MNSIEIGFSVAGVLWCGYLVTRYIVYRRVLLSVIQEDFPHVTYKTVVYLCKVLRSNASESEIAAVKAIEFGRRYRCADVEAYSKIIKETW